MFITEQLLLQHSDSSKQYCAGLNELRKAEELFDVTLATEDDVIEAHKVLLCANSPFFRKIMAKTKNREHPFIYLKGVKTEHLKIALDLLYNGESSIPTSELDKFLAMAKELEIAGLTEEEVKSEKEYVKTQYDSLKDKERKLSSGYNSLKAPRKRDFQNIDMSREVFNQELASVTTTSTNDCEVEELSVKVDPIITEVYIEETDDNKGNMDVQTLAESEDYTTEVNFDLDVENADLNTVPNTGETSPTCDLSRGNYLDVSASRNTRKANNQFLTLFNDTMEALRVRTGNSVFKPLEETTIEELPNALSEFFRNAVKKDGTIFNASSYTQFYHVGVRFLKEKYHTPVDIKEDVRFKKVYDVVKAQCSKAVSLGARPGMNASKAIDPQLIRLAYQKGNLGREKPRALVRTVHLNLMTEFGCRSYQEEYDILNKDIEYGPLLPSSEYPEFIKLGDRLTKTRRGLRIQEEGKVYLDNENPDTCAVRNIVAYQNKKTAEQLNDDYPFLLCVNIAAEANPDECKKWYTNRMGINQFGTLLKKVLGDTLKE